MDNRSGALRVIGIVKALFIIFHFCFRSSLVNSRLQVRRAGRIYMENEK
jgi:hypothetical protein